MYDFISGIPAARKAYFVTPPPTFKHQERHWHTGDTDMDESDPYESEIEHPDDTDVDENDPDKRERNIRMVLIWKRLR